MDVTQCAEQGRVCNSGVRRLQQSLQEASGTQVEIS
jgi:hypothetical protein